MNFPFRSARASLLSMCVMGIASFAGSTAFGQTADEDQFTLVVIPDTQNAIDFTRQTAEGFAIDSSDIFIEQMRHIASRSAANGGDVAFVASVGDVWQHASSNEDAEHFARGVTSIDNPLLAANFPTYEETLSIEVPKAIEGYELISEAGIPFGVAPGNHDYDAIWAASAFPPNLDVPFQDLEPSTENYGTLHLGGLSNFNQAFGSDTKFFKDKPWYVDGYRGGGNSAQIFEAGGYQFLHFAFELHAGDDVLAWAQEIIDENPGLPTIITTHDYMNRFGERTHSIVLNLAAADPDFNNTSQQIWDKFISQNDQIFMVLCGHNIGQALRVDNNAFDHKVYQVMSDYQERGQAGVDGGQPLRENGTTVGIGDGWYREMRFDFSDEVPSISVKTFSSHYDTYSGDLETYATWYQQQEQPDMSDADFYQADDYVIELEDFYNRFKRN